MNIEYDENGMPHIRLGRNTEIPKGPYCYDGNGLCPHWSIREDQPEQHNGYCDYLKRGDWEAPVPDDFPPHFPTSCLSLLWDKVKECGINDEWDDEDEENAKTELTAGEPEAIIGHPEQQGQDDEDHPRPDQHDSP